MLKGAGIPSTVPRTDTTNTFTQTQTFSNATSAINVSSTSGKITIGGDAGANAFTQYYSNATNSIVFQIGRDGSGSDFYFRTGNYVYGRFKYIGVNGAAALHIAEGMTVPAGGTAGAGLSFSSTANLGVYFGSGVPTLSAAQGSLYMRTDGSTTSTRLYVNTNGTTGWTAVTTAT